MRFRRGHRSSNVEYRASSRGRAIAGGVGGLGVVGVLLAVLLGAFGGSDGGFDVGAALEGLGAAPAPTGGPAELPPRNDFLEFVFDDVQDTWAGLYDQAGQSYQPSRMVIFDEAVQTGGCGSATAAVGPFYCPADGQVYLDQSFFDELARRFGAPGDFAQAYVVAHEVGHHVQNVAGISADVRRLQQANPEDANELSVLLELQADCLAGVWAYGADRRGLLERGDLEEGLGAASAVGDDNLQRRATGTIDRESWTHGSSEERVEWFRRGFETGDPERCNTFE